MDEGSEREYEARKSMHATQCMPRLWRKSTTAVATQGSLLDRFRETVLKVIMISAISGKGGGGRRTRGEQVAGGGGGGGRQQYVRHLHPDSYQSEAVEECIEFFKRSAAAEEEGGESASSVCEEAQDLEVGFASLQVM